MICRPSSRIEETNYWLSHHLGPKNPVSLLRDNLILSISKPEDLSLNNFSFRSKTRLYTVAQVAKLATVTALSTSNHPLSQRHLSRSPRQAKPVDPLSMQNVRRVCAVVEATSAVGFGPDCWPLSVRTDQRGTRLGVGVDFCGAANWCQPKWGKCT